MPAPDALCDADVQDFGVCATELDLQCQDALAAVRAEV